MPIEGHLATSIRQATMLWSSLAMQHLYTVAIGRQRAWLLYCLLPATYKRSAHTYSMALRLCCQIKRHIVVSRLACDLEAHEMMWNCTCGLVYSIDRGKPHQSITFSFAVRFHSEYIATMTKFYQV